MHRPMHRRAAGVALAVALALPGLVAAEPQPERQPRNARPGPVAAEPEAEREARNERPGRPPDMMQMIEGRLNEVREQTLARVEEWWDRERRREAVAEAAVEPLGRTLQLKFTAMPDQELEVVLICASRRFALVSDRRQPGGMLHFEVRGQVAPVDDPAAGFLVSYDLETNREGEGGFEHVMVTGSVLAKLGQETQIVGLDRERVLLLTVTDVAAAGR